MTWRSFFKWTGLLSLIGLLTYGPGQAQQEHVAESNRSGSVSGVRATAEAPVAIDTNGTVAKTAEDGESKAGENTSSASPSQPPAPLPVAKVGKATLLEKAYFDAFSILKEDNSCSRFYGGSASIEVLNELTRQIRPTYLGRDVALRMSGLTSSVRSMKYSLAYRLFEKAELNLTGPFYVSRVVNSDATVPRIGTFQPNTRAARVTILLHELGHLIRRADQQWLLPNDGSDSQLSRQNTMQVIAVCGEQINSLGKRSAV